MLGSMQGGLRLCSEVRECIQEFKASLEIVQRGLERVQRVMKVSCEVK